MKRHLSKFAAGITGLVLASQANALNIKLESPVGVKDDFGRTVIQAYNDAKNCRLWYYLPGHQMVTGTFLNRSGVSSFTVEGGAKHFSYISTMDMRGNPEIQQRNLDDLKQKIAVTAGSDPSCKNEKISKDDIILSPGLARPVVDTKYDTSRVFYSDVMPTYNSKKNFVDPTNPISITYVIDASYKDANNNWIKELQNIQAESVRAPIQIGSLHYVLDGVTQQLDAELTVEGEMDATFASQVVDQGCDTSEHEKHLGGAIGGLGAGGVGFGAGSLGYSEKNKTCATKLATWLSDANLPVHARLKMNGFKYVDAEGKPLYVVACDDKGKCKSAELENFVRAQLWNLWLSNNFDSLLQSASSLLMANTPGRSGKSTLKINLTSQYSRSFYGEIALDVPVYATNLVGESFDFSNANSPIAVCASQDYYSQVLTFDQPVGVYPIPVSSTCVGKGAQ